MVHDWRGTAEQMEALTVACSFCKAPAGSPCVNEGVVLRAFPAHDIRVRTAKKIQEAS